MRVYFPIGQSCRRIFVAEIHVYAFFWKSQHKEYFLFLLSEVFVSQKSGMQSMDYWSRKRPILNQVENAKGKDLISFASIVTPKQ